MTKWIECTLDKLGEIVSGATPSTKCEDYYGGSIPWITPKDLSSFNGRYITKGERNLTEKGLASCSAQMMPKDAVLFTSRAPIGYVAIASQSVCTNQGFKSIVVNEKADPLFVYYLLKYNKDDIEAMGSGTTFKEVSGKTMRAVKVHIPLDVNYQRQIAAVLDSLDTKIENNEKINDHLEQQAITIFRERFLTDPESKGWPLVTLGSLTSLVSRGIAPKYTDNSAQIVLNQKCIREHYIDVSLGRLHVPKVINEKWLKYGDLLINSTGEGTLGRSAQVWFVPESMTVDSHITIVRAKSQLLWFYIGFWGISHEREIEALHTGSTGQTELPRDRVKAMELYLPDNDTLTHFNDVITPLVSTIVVNHRENAHLASIRDTLLPKLMSGEIDVSTVQL